MTAQRLCGCTDAYGKSPRADCPYCQGTNRLPTPMTDNNALAQELEASAINCAFCNGAGDDGHGNTCWQCDGQGAVWPMRSNVLAALRTPAPVAGEVGGRPASVMMKDVAKKLREYANDNAPNSWRAGIARQAADMLERLAAPVQEPDADNTPHAFVWAAPDTCRNCGNTEDHPVHQPTPQPGAGPEQVERVARALYKASCALDPVEATEPDWGRGGYKTQIIYWEGLARAALTALTPSAVAGQPKYATDEDRRAARDFFGSWPRVTVPDYLEPALAQTLAAHRLLGQQQGARGMQWQPIETAQRDGSFVILHLAHGEPDVSIGYYDGGPEWLFVEADILPTAAYPTHWMPLPAPPASLPEEG